VPNPVALLYAGSTTPSRSSVIKDSHNPVWNQHFEFTINYALTDLTVTIFDDDAKNSKKILGKVLVDLEPFKNAGPIKKTFRLAHVEKHESVKSTGESSVELQIEFSVSPLTLPSVKTKVFGVDLKKIMAREDHVGETVPKFISSAINILKNYATVEGIFRISGSANEMHEMKIEIDGGNPLVLNPSDNVHNFCGLLKLYLRELPEPLLTYELCNDFLAAPTNPQATKAVVSRLPKENYQVLHALVEFLAVVASYSEQNKMVPSNLGIVIGPNILRSKTDADAIMITAVSQAVVATMITAKDVIFT